MSWYRFYNDEKYSGCSQRSSRAELILPCLYIVWEKQDRLRVVIVLRQSMVNNISSENIVFVFYFKNKIYLFDVQQLLLYEVLGVWKWRGHSWVERGKICGILWDVLQWNDEKARVEGRPRWRFWHFGYSLSEWRLGILKANGVKFDVWIKCRI